MHDVEPLDLVQPEALKLEQMAACPHARTQLRTGDAGLLPEFSNSRCLKGLPS